MKMTNRNHRQDRFAGWISRRNRFSRLSWSLILVAAAPLLAAEPPEVLRPLQIPIHAENKDTAELPPPYAVEQPDHSPGRGEPINSGSIRIPVANDGDIGKIQVRQATDTVSLFVRDASLHQVISMVAKASGRNIVITDQASERISITLNDVPFVDAMEAILSVGGYTSSERNNILYVSKVDDDRVPAGVQGRVMKVFTLDFAAADDVQAAIQGLLSGVGTSSVVRSDSSDHRRTRELVVVEDLPHVVERVARYVEHIDIPPRQVLIEAHILQVDLGDELRHGVNIERLAEAAGGDISLEVRGFADRAASQGFVATIDGNDVGAVIEAIKTTNVTKTLAAPKVLVVNGQDAHLQVGEQLAYRTTLTTQTATQETIQFLPIGVVLDVRPQISRDGRILMYVKPKVSSGRINPENQLPEERKTEVETDVLLRDGEGLVIGGLIQENQSNDQAKVPWIGDLNKVGLLFQRRAKSLARSEIIVTLIPRIVPLDHPYGQSDVPRYYTERHQLEYQRANTPLTRGSIYGNPRYHLEDPIIDAADNGVRLRDKRRTRCAGKGDCVDVYASAAATRYGDFTEESFEPIEPFTSEPTPAVPVQIPSHGRGEQIFNEFGGAAVIDARTLTGRATQVQPSSTPKPSTVRRLGYEQQSQSSPSTKQKPSYATPSRGGNSRRPTTKQKQQQRYSGRLKQNR